MSGAFTFLEHTYLDLYIPILYLKEPTCLSEKKIHNINFRLRLIT